jgi:hypothetical protein
MTEVIKPTKPVVKKPALKEFTALKNLALGNNKQIKKGCTFTCTDEQAEVFSKAGAI